MTRTVSSSELERAAELADAFGLSVPDGYSLTEAEAADRALFISRIIEGKSPENAGLSIGWSMLHIRKVTAEPDMVEIIDFIRTCKVGSMEEAVYNMGLRGNFQAAQWWLLNRAPDSWKDTKRVVVDTTGTLSIEVTHSVKAVALELLREHGVAALQPGGALDVIDVESIDVTDADLVPRDR